MKILLDTNVLISAVVFGGKAKQMIWLLQEKNYEIYVSEYIEQEFKNKLKEKWPTVSDEAYRLYKSIGFPVLKSTNAKLGDLRDPKDVPVLSDAIQYEVDVLVTGDKDFLEADMKRPVILSPAMMFEYLTQRSKHQ